MRTKTEIDNEIAALKALKPLGLWKHKTQAALNAAIEELEFRVDQTAEEFHALSATEQNAIREANDWKNGFTDKRPSQGWEGLVK